MFHFRINGKEVEYDDGLNLLQILREKEKLTATKDGCSEGACGTCMVLVDGRAMRACLQKPSRHEGKSVITVEGPTDREKGLYAYAFSKLGAGQCGFCMPGRALTAKGLLDKNHRPTGEEVRTCIQGNMRRFLGRQKID